VTRRAGVVAICLLIAAIGIVVLLVRAAGLDGAQINAMLRGLHTLPSALVAAGLAAMCWCGGEKWRLAAGLGEPGGGAPPGAAPISPIPPSAC